MSYMISTNDTDILADVLKNGRENKELNIQKENLKKTIEQRDEEVRNKSIDYVIKNVIGRFRDVLPIENVEGQNRLIEFAHVCLSEDAPMSQGYYFENEENINQFIKEVLLAYYVGNIERYKPLWTVIDSVELVDYWMINKWIDNTRFTTSSVTQYDLFFIVNSYNRYFKGKRHKMLYGLAGWVMDYRDRENWRTKNKTFILSLTKDVGSDKGPNHGFSIPMYPIKEKIKAVLSNKENSKKYLW